MFGASHPKVLRGPSAGHVRAVHECSSFDLGHPCSCPVIGKLVLLAWDAYELRHHDPLVDLRTTASRPVLFTNLAALLIGFGMMAG